MKMGLPFSKIILDIARWQYESSSSTSNTNDEKYYQPDISNETTEYGRIV